MNFKHFKVSAFLLGLLGSSSVLCMEEQIRLIPSAQQKSFELSVTLEKKTYSQVVDFNKLDSLRTGMQTPFGEFRVDNTNTNEYVTVISPNLFFKFNAKGELYCSLPSHSPLLSVSVTANGAVEVMSDKEINWSINCDTAYVLETRANEVNIQADTTHFLYPSNIEALHIRPNRSPESAVICDGDILAKSAQLTNCKFTANRFLYIMRLVSDNSSLFIRSSSQCPFFTSENRNIIELCGHVNSLSVLYGTKLQIRRVILDQPPQLFGQGVLEFGRPNYNIACSIAEQRTMQIFQKLIRLQNLVAPKSCFSLLKYKAGYRIGVLPNKKTNDKMINIENIQTGQGATFSINFENKNTFPLVNGSAGFYRFHFERSNAVLELPSIAMRLMDDEVEIVSAPMPSNIGYVDLFFSYPTADVKISNKLVLRTLDVECADFINEQRVVAKTINIKTNNMRNTGRISSKKFSISAAREATDRKLFNHGEIRANDINISYMTVKTYIKTWKSIHANVINFTESSLILENIKDWYDEKDSSFIDFTKITGTPWKIHLGDGVELLISHWLGQAPKRVSGSGVFIFDSLDIAQINAGDPQVMKNLSNAIQASQEKSQKESDDEYDDIECNGTYEE